MNSQQANITRFDKEAAQWDSNPTTRQASEKALEAIVQNVPRLSQQNASKCAFLI
jgi:hypothetical protein